ncbi:MAG: MotA/TolQ/ExbB proton channel family protein [Bdellovibrionales bacterium]|nr:MotA/TolQ/ExbB proton channel family protein [Bdellovibrionales bacterium]
MAYVLAFLSLILWYALGYRYFSLKTSYLDVHPGKIIRKKSISDSDLLGAAVLQLKSLFQKPLQDRETAIRSAMVNMTNGFNTHKQTIKSIVVVAPLLGLLGTVIGMIETFSSLQDSALFSQSGGIAGGISQALITTQMGLVVAIPGLLMGRKLDRHQEKVETYLEQVISLLATSEESQ